MIITKKFTTVALQSSAPQTKQCNVSAEYHWRLRIRLLF